MLVMAGNLFRFVFASIFVLLFLQQGVAAEAPQTASVERFALLIGVDDYAPSPQQSGRVTPLKGPANDVALVKQLLVSQYKFADDAAHIVELIGKQATREAILKTVRSHLIERAATHPQSTIVFYFSGHGSLANNVSPGDGSTHSTLVAYDSRASGGKDIVDNELIDLFEELRKYTSNITFILDSCHSGSAIKGIDSPTLTSRSAPPNPRQFSAGGRVDGPAGKSGEATGSFLTRRQQFALLSASHAEELSYEDKIDTTSGKKFHGFFTFYLVQALNSRPALTVELAMRDVGLSLARALPYQHPQAVGRIEGRIFGDASDREDPYVKIVSQPANGSFEIEAGRTLGLREGTFLAIYAPTAKRLTGEKDKIANAQISKLGDVRSTAAVSGPVAKPFGQDAKVAIVAPYLGSEKLRINVSELPGQQMAGDDAGLLHQLSEMLSSNQLVRPAGRNESWNVAIRRGCADGGKLVLSSDLSRAAKDCSAVYYLTEKGDRPLFQFLVPANSASRVVDLVDRIERFARQENLRGLDNESSPFREQLQVRLIKVDLKAGAGPEPDVIPRPVDGADTAEPMRIDQRFQIEVRNNSERELYAAVFMLGSSGRIELVTSNPNGDLVHAHSNMVMHSPRKIGLPLGRESYKVIATTVSSVDFRLLEPMTGAKGGGGSLFDFYQGKAIGGAAKDSTSVDLDSWATAIVDVLVVP